MHIMEGNDRRDEAVILLVPFHPCCTHVCIQTTTTGFLLGASNWKTRRFPPRRRRVPRPWSLLSTFNPWSIPWIMHGFQQDDILPSRLYHVHVDSIILTMMMRYTRFTHLSIAQIVCRFFHNKQSPLQPTGRRERDSYMPRRIPPPRDDGGHHQSHQWMRHHWLHNIIWSIHFTRFSRTTTIVQTTSHHDTFLLLLLLLLGYCWQQTQFFNFFLCTSQNGCTEECCFEEYQLFW